MAVSQFFNMKCLHFLRCAFCFFQAAESQDIKLTDSSTNRCVEGFDLNIRCEASSRGLLSLSSPRDGEVANVNCNLTDLNNPRYTIEECEQSSFVEVVVSPSDYQKDQGTWLCTYNGGQQRGSLDVHVGKKG